MRNGACHWFIPTPIAPTRALVPHPDQLRDGFGDGLVHVRIGIVDVRDVHAVDAEPLETRLQRAPDPGRAEVETSPERVHDVEPAGRQIRAGRVRIRFEQPTDLRRQDVRVAGPVGQRRTETGLGQSESVVRRRVVVAHPTGPRGIDRSAGVVVARRAVEVAERSPAEAEPGQRDAADLASVHGPVPFGPTASSTLAKRYQWAAVPPRTDSRSAGRNRSSAGANVVMTEP